jgi:hypothetical protein
MYAIVPAVGDHVAVDPHDELEVLADAVGVEAADLHENVAPEHPERSADQDKRAEPGPARAPQHERPQVLDDLDPDEPRPGQLDLDKASIHYLASIDRADNPAGRDDTGGVVRKRFGDRDERIRFQDRVGVDEHHQRLGGGVDADVDRIGSAGVLLSHHDQSCASVPRDVHVDDDAPGREVAGHCTLDRYEVESPAQLFEHRIGAAIVDDDHLVSCKAQREQGLNRGDDHHLLVQRWHDDRNPLPQLAGRGLFTPGGDGLGEQQGPWQRAQPAQRAGGDHRDVAG